MQRGDDIDQVVDGRRNGGPRTGTGGAQVIGAAPDEVQRLAVGAGARTGQRSRIAPQLLQHAAAKSNAGPRAKRARRTGGGAGNRQILKLRTAEVQTGCQALNGHRPVREAALEIRGQRKSAAVQRKQPTVVGQAVTEYHQARKNRRGLSNGQGGGGGADQQQARGGGSVGRTKKSEQGHQGSR